MVRKYVIAENDLKRLYALWKGKYPNLDINQFMENYYIISLSKLLGLE